MIIIIYLIFVSKVLWVEQQHEKVRQKRGHHHQKVVARGITPRFADPLWDEQWYLVRKQHLKKFLFIDTAAEREGQRGQFPQISLPLLLRSQTQGASVTSFAAGPRKPLDGPVCRY